MANTIGPSSPAASAQAAPLFTPEQTNRIEGALAQKMMLGMQANQQALNKSVTKMTDAIKNAVQDE